MVVYGNHQQQYLWLIGLIICGCQLTRQLESTNDKLSLWQTAYSKVTWFALPLNPPLEIDSAARLDSVSCLIWEQRRNSCSIWTKCNRHINYDNNQPHAEEHTLPNRFHWTIELYFCTKASHDVQQKKKHWSSKAVFQWAWTAPVQKGCSAWWVDLCSRRWNGCQNKVFLKLLTWVEGGSTNWLFLTKKTLG